MKHILSRTRKELCHSLWPVDIWMCFNHPWIPLPSQVLLTECFLLTRSIGALPLRPACSMSYHQKTVEFSVDLRVFSKQLPRSNNVSCWGCLDQTIFLVGHLICKCHTKDYSRLRLDRLGDGGESAVSAVKQAQAVVEEIFFAIKGVLFSVWRSTNG